MIGKRGIRSELCPGPSVTVPLQQGPEDGYGLPDDVSNNTTSSLGEAVSNGPELAIMDGGVGPGSPAESGDDFNNGGYLPPGKWEGEEIVGEEIVDSELHNWIRWKNTLEPESNLGNIRKLIIK